MGKPARSWLVVAALAAILVAGNFPYLYGWSIRPEGTRFWAVPPVNYSDADQYLAFTRLAAEGHVLINDPFTAEPTKPRLFMPQVMAQGLSCRLFGWSPLEALQASRVVSGALLLLASWWLGTLLLRSGRLRWWYLAFLGASGGAGWFLDRLHVTIPNGDFFQPEGNTFFMLGNLPNLALSAALLTTLFATVLALERRPERSLRWFSIAFAASVLLSWTHPFDFATLALVLPAYAAVRWVCTRRFPLSAAAHAFTVLVGALPAAAYLTWLTRTDPIYRALADDPTHVQSFAYYALAHGLLALPVAYVLCRKELRTRYSLPLTWVLCVFLFLCLPFRMGGKQARMVGGIHAPLALLAVVGLDAAARQARRRLRRRALSTSVGGGIRKPRAWIVTGVLGGYWLLTASGAWGMAERQIRAYSSLSGDYYQTPRVEETLDYLSRHATEREVTLAGPFTESWAPVLAKTRVFTGHWQLTLHVEEKERWRNWFFFTPGHGRQKAHFLSAAGITWVIWYPEEWGAQIVPVDDVPGLAIVYRTPELWLYRFHVD